MIIFRLLSLFGAASWAFSPKATPPDAVLRSELAREFGIEAIDKTDRHAPVVLENLLFLLRNAFPPGFVQRLGSVRYLYAYSGHDSVYDLGAYHPEEMAISVGGVSSYSQQETSIDPRILATLAHELGHAFLLTKLSPSGLRALGERYGGWTPVFAGQPAKDFYAKAFFTPMHALESSFENPLGSAATAWKAKSICSRLASTNIHEWFADAFAAYALSRLGEKGLLGKDWRKRLVFSPRIPSEYWSDYNLLSSDLAASIKDKVEGSRAVASRPQAP